MTIHHFAENQNVVFVPALFALLAATVLVCLPILLGQTLQRSGRRVPVTVAAWALAAVALGVSGWQTSIGVGMLAHERAEVRTGLAARYGIDLTAAEVDELVNGGKPKRTLPQQAAAAGLLKPDQPHALQLVPVDEGGDVYRLAIGGRTIPVAVG
ncbi:hypothetical protein [uncultured Amnibacterium sp.]|uniref:hypothetical protein n=1 Tax=uncultured Amnibacterium sp. TaxID=1631851 RepID=UPI0035CA0C02